MPPLDENCAWFAIYFGCSLVLIAVYFLGCIIIPSKSKKSTCNSFDDSGDKS